MQFVPINGINYCRYIVWLKLFLKLYFQLTFHFKVIKQLKIKRRQFETLNDTLYIALIQHLVNKGYCYFFKIINSDCRESNYNTGIPLVVHGIFDFRNKNNCKILFRHLEYCLLLV